MSHRTTVGTLESKRRPALESEHHGVALSQEEQLRIRTWIDLNCPLWPDYVERSHRSGPEVQVTKAE